MVSRCICCNQTFSQALDIADKECCCNVAELQAHMNISTKCGLCVPYLQRAIETGDTVIPLMNSGESAGWRKRSGLEEPESEL